MRKFFLSVALALLFVGTVTVSSADAQLLRRNRVYYAPDYVYPSYSYYYEPGGAYYYEPGYYYYSEPYYYYYPGWRGRWWR